MSKFKPGPDESKIASKFHIFQNYMDSNSNQRLIMDFRCTSKSILFSYVEFCKQGGEFKMFNLIFKWLAQKKFNLKMNFFALPANMEWRY